MSLFNASIVSLTPETRDRSQLMELIKVKPNHVKKDIYIYIYILTKNNNNNNGNDKNDNSSKSS